jgi:putative sterol carrier protein
MRYLSLDWIEEIARLVAANADLQTLGAQHSIGITQVITEAPEGTVIYHLQAGNGSVSFGAGPAEPEDVRLEQEWFTAVDVATGEMTAEDAFITGCIRLSGNAPLLLECQAVFAGLDPIFSAVADRTDYSS